MAALKPYYFGQTCSKLRNDSIEDSKVEFADFLKNTKSVTGFFSFRQFVTLDQRAIGPFFKLMAL